MAQSYDVRATGDRVEAILADLAGSVDPGAARSAEELVRLLVELYGAGLRDIMTTAAAEDPDLPVRLAENPLVASLLLVHDLHPLDADTRIQRALDQVRPYLGSHAGGVRYHGIDTDGVVQLSLEGSCHGCPSSTVTVRLAIERAVRDAAPEAAGVEVAGQVPEPARSPLLQIGRRPPGDEWTRVARPAGGGGVHAVTLADLAVVLCSVGDDLYAYRDTCPGCGAALSAGTLAEAVLRCPDCAGTFDVRRAGAGLRDPDQHLQPLPLLAEGDGVRIAVGAGALR